MTNTNLNSNLHTSAIVAGGTSFDTATCIGGYKRDLSLYSTQVV